MKNELKNTALLVMDVQPGIIDRISNKDVYLSKVNNAVAVAHENNIPVIHVVVGFPDGFPEINPNNKSFSAIKNSIPAYLMNAKPVLDVVGNDVLVTKRRVSAFTGSDLEVVLRSKGIHHLVLSGIATSGVVLSTLREAADKDYQITVLSDICADMDEEVHRVLLEKVFPRQATVITSEHWIND